MTDEAGSGEDVNTNTVTEEIISNQENNQQTNREPFKFLLSLPDVHSSLSAQVSSLSDEACVLAAAIFQHLRTEKTATQQLLHYDKKTDTPLPETGDRTTQKQAFQLAFSTLKYQDLLEDIITDSCFHTSQRISRDLLPLAMVMLFDFQNRKFFLHERSTKDRKEPLHEVRDMERSLLRWKTKLAASLARCRVKQSLQSVSCFLSEPVRTKQHRAKHLPLYAWVNTLKTSVEEVCKALKRAGLSEVKNLSELKESAFCRDPLCADTLVFSQQLHALLPYSTVTYAVNIQDRSVCIAVSALRPLLFENGDVLMVGSFSAMTVAHVAVAAAARSGRVLVCGADHTPSHIEEIQELLSQMDIKNAKVLSEAFFGLDEWDTGVQRLKVIIVLPQCSSSALNDPVPTMHSEHGDWDLLLDLSHGSLSQSKKHTVTTQQARLLSHALSFPKVQTVVYCTRSVYPEENELLVKRVLEKTHFPSKLLPFRVNGPVFPGEPASGDTADSRFFSLEPSQLTNGCFIARLSRQADPTKVETVQDVLARAAAKGLLGGIIPEQSKTGKKGKSKKNHGASAGSKPPSPHSYEREMGEELENGKDQVVPLEQDEQRGESNEEEIEVKGGKKKRGLKGQKRKASQQPKQSSRTTADSKNPSQSHKKKPTKRKIKRRLMKTKPRRIPRLTLSLISSAKPPKHLSPITAVAHKLIDAPAANPQLAVFCTPSSASSTRPAPPAASKSVQREHTETVKVNKKIQDEPGCVLKTRRKAEKTKSEVVAETALKESDFVLPPVSSPSSGSLSGRSVSSPSQRPSRASQSELAQISASSSCISLPGL